MSELDKIDVRIVDLLMQNGRMSAAEIARQVGDISERSVRYRIQKLEEDGLIRISAIVNPKYLGLSVVADVFIEVETGKILEVARQLAEFECVSYVACAIGERDISVQVVARSSDDVYKIVTETIAKIPGILKTTTSIVPLVLKDVYEWHIPKSLYSP
jgi:Lrp/AsnC family transcriptional regulator for asnA, asnC and gidA